MPAISKKIAPSLLPRPAVDKCKASELYQTTCFALPVVPASPGFFRIFIEENFGHKFEPFEPILDPVIAWRIDYYAIPVTADQFDEVDGSYAVLHPSGRITYPFVGEFESLIQLANYENRRRRAYLKKPKKQRFFKTVISLVEFRAMRRALARRGSFHIAVCQTRFCSRKHFEDLIMSSRVKNHRLAQTPEVEIAMLRIISAAPDYFYIPLPSESGDCHFAFERFPIVGWEIDCAGHALPITAEFGRPTSDYGFAIQFPSGDLRVHDIYPRTQFDTWEEFVEAMHAFAHEENTSNNLPGGIS